MVHSEKDHVHEQASYPPVAIGKRVNDGKRGMKVGRHGKGATVIGEAGCHIIEKVPHKVWNIHRVSADSLRANNVVASFVRAGPFPAPSMPLVIGTIGQELMSLKDKVLSELP